MSYQLVEDLHKKAVPAITVSQACRILEVSRSGYYAAAKRRRATPAACAASVYLKAAFAASGRTYGSRRLLTALRARGLTMGRHRVRSLMRANALRSVWKRKFVHTTDSKHAMPVSANVLARQFDRPLPNQAWVCDITYLRTRSGWLYLATVLDCIRARLWAGRWPPRCPQRWCAQPCKWLSAAQSGCGSACAFGPGDAVRQRGASGAFDKVWPDWQHEPQRQLLGQRGYGAILSEPEDGAGLAKRLRQPRRSNDRCG